jgi:hypothetical protein
MGRIPTFIVVTSVIAAAASIVYYCNVLLPDERKQYLEKEQTDKEQALATYKGCITWADTQFAQTVLHWSSPMSNSDYDELRRDREIEKDRCMKEYKAGIY